MINFQTHPRLAVLPAACLAVTLTFAGTGCSNIHDDSTRTKTEGTLVGGGIGAALGALFGGLIGGNGKGALIGAGIGAGIGSLAGFFVGKHVADKKAEYASREDWLDDCIAHTRKVTDETREYNAKLSKDINTLDAESKKLRTAYKKKQVEKSDMQKGREAVLAMKEDTDKNIKQLQEEVKKDKTVLADAKANGNKKEAAELDKEIKELNAQISQMKKYNQKLASISARLAV